MRRVLVLAALLATAPAAAQTPAALTADDYARAERFLAASTNPLVSGASVRPTWLSNGRFWYNNTIQGGHEFMVVDPARKTRARVFDHERIATALGSALGRTLNAADLPFDRFDMTADGGSISFDLESRSYTCDLSAWRCTSASMGVRAGDRNAVVSPDGRLAAYIRDFNLWVRDVQTGQETQLTTDGVKDFGYATDNAGWTKSDRAIVMWSPDSKKIATFQQDERNVGMMYLVSTAVGHPELQAWRYPLPGDSVIQMIHRVIIDVPARQVVRLKMPPDAHRSTLCDHIACRGEWADIEWYPDGSHLAFVSTSRDHKQANMRIADSATGDVREVMEEVVATQYESGSGRVNWHVLPATNELIWFSERDDWGNLYLYDATGSLKSRITTGEGPVLQLLRIDEKSRTLWFTAAGREPGRDPYFRHLYRIGMDGKNQKLLTPEVADHEITLSPDGRWFVDSYSTPATPPVTVVRDMEGRLALQVEKADISRLVASGWTPPEPFTVKARDGVSDLYGLMYRPTGFDPSRKYPIVNYVYPGPQTGSVGSRSFSAARGDKRAMAELGFIVVEVDAMGTPMRSKSFHDAYYGNMGDNGLPDQIAMIRQLAAKNPWMDIDHVGIWGHSGGGFATADAMLRYPDFYKVGVSQAGNHDNRTYEDDWGERYQGLLVRNPDGTTNYDDQANQTHAVNLKGKLLIAHGTLDNNVPPNNTLMLVNELIRNNQDFDLIMMPNRAHGFGNEAYMTRRRWDYFVRWLMGAEPPAKYEIGKRVVSDATDTGGGP